MNAFDSCDCKGPVCHHNGDRILQLDTVRRRLNRPERTVRFWAEKGWLRGRKVGKLWIFREPDVVAFEKTLVAEEYSRFFAKLRLSLYCRAIPEQGGHMRHPYVVVVVLALLATAAGQSLRIDERASKVTLNGKTYAVVLTANSTKSHQSAVVKLDVITPSDALVASTSSLTQLKIGTNKLSASVSLPELPKKTGRALVAQNSP